MTLLTRAVGRTGGALERRTTERRPLDGCQGDTLMNDVFLFQWFKDVPIARKLYFTVGIMALLISVELFALFFSLNTLSSLRAYVGGEGLWSKAQKDAVFHLYKYGASRTQEDYTLFEEFMKVPVGDGKTRQELQKEIPDRELARQGFLEGRNHPDDVDGMIKLFRNFRDIYYIEKAIRLIPLRPGRPNVVTGAALADKNDRQHRSGTKSSSDGKHPGPKPRRVRMDRPPRWGPGR